MILFLPVVPFLLIGALYLFVTRRRWRERMLADHLAAVVRQNLPLQAAFFEISRDFGGSIGRAFHRMYDRLLQGDRISDAVSACGGGLPPNLRNALILGDRSGNLGPFLEEAARAADESERSRPRIELLLVYPLFLMLTISGMIALSGTFIRGFRKIFDDLGTRLGGPVWSLDYIPGAAFGLFFVGLTIAVLACWGPSRRRLAFLDRIALRIPWIRRLEMESSMEQVSLTLALFLRAGARLHEAVGAAAALDINRVVRDRLFALSRRLEEGGSIDAFLKDESLLPREFAWMAGIGVASGRLDEQLLRAALLYRSRTRTAAFLAARLAVPVVTLINGLFVLGIVSTIGASLSGIIRGLIW